MVQLQIDGVTLVALLRDLVLIIFLTFSIIALLVAVVLGFMLYRKVSRILESANRISRNVQEGSSLVTERVLRPLTTGPGLVGSVRQVMDSVERLFHRDGRGEDERAP